MGIQRTNKSKIKKIDLSDDTSVGSGGGTNVQNLQPPSGYIYRVRDIRYNAPAVGAAGSHKLYIDYATFDTTIHEVAFIQSGFGDAVEIGPSGFVGTTSESPANIYEQYEIMHKILTLNNTEYLAITYENSTNAAQSGTRKLEILVEEIPERA